MLPRRRMPSKNMTAPTRNVMGMKMVAMIVRTFMTSFIRLETLER